MCRSDSFRFVTALAAAILSLLVCAPRAHADTVQAPVGGKVVPLGGARVACPGPTGGPTGDWAVDANGARPPTDEASIGKVTEVRVAASAAACATTTSTVSLVATARMPQIDPTSVTLAVDEGRLDLRGRNLKGMGVRWIAGGRSGEDRCAQPESVGGVERCSFSVARGLPADPGGVVLTWFPAGGRAGDDVATYDAAGRRVSVDETLIRPARVVVTTLVPSNVSIDLAGDVSRVPLAHPEAIASVDCGAASCELANGAVVVRSVRNVAGAITVRTRLVPHVFFARGGSADALDAAPSFSVSVLPCAMTIASGEALRGVDDARVVVRLDPRCAGEARTMRFTVGATPAEVMRIETDAGAAYVLLRVGRVEGAELAVTALRGDAESSVIGVARTRTRAAPQPRAALEIEGRGAIDFLPTNREARVSFADPGERAHLVLLPLDGVYEVHQAGNATLVRGVAGAAGYVALHFGYRVEGLPAALASVDIAVIPDPVERPLRVANVPAPLGASAMSAAPIVELLCDAGDGKPTRVTPGVTTHIPYGARDSCRLVLHRERLAPEDGEQALDLTIDVARVDGEPRSDAHVAQGLVLRPGTTPRYVWIRGVSGPFDRVTVRLAHAADEAHYVGGDELRSENAPSVQWAVIAGEGHARIYATTAIPTGLYRVSDRDHSGILTLNFGVIARFTWLDAEGHEGVLGLEAGVMGIGLANDVSSRGQSLTQVATVFGAGLSVPIANRSLATETSINLHAWGEYEISRDLGSGSGSPFGFVFGPSISIGNVGANL